MNSRARTAFERLRDPKFLELRARLRHGRARQDQPERVFDLRSPREWFRLALRKAGIKDFRWHDLRHTVGSRATMQGVPLKAVQELLGHHNITTTMRYAHLSPEFQQAAVDSLLAY